jgi:hypothetical protein
MRRAASGGIILKAIRVRSEGVVEGQTAGVGEVAAARSFKRRVHVQQYKG